MTCHLVMPGGHPGDDFLMECCQMLKKSYKIGHATLQVETGIEYAELRGVMLRCDVEIHRDVEVVTDFAMELVERYAGGAEGTREAFATQAPKRVALEFVERDRVTWDHRKLGGTY